MICCQTKTYYHANLPFQFDSVNKHGLCGEGAGGLMKVTIYHNPRCSKSRLTLGLLQDRGVEFEVIEYLKTPPTANQLAHILALLRLKPRELMRRNEKEYQSLSLDDPSLSTDALINAMIAHPILIQRPIVVANGKAAIGRPPEAVLDVL